MLWGGIRLAQSGAAVCGTAGCAIGRTLLPWVAALTLFTAALAVARLLGPVVASAAEGTWLLDTPINRAKLLRGRLLAVVLVQVAGSALAVSAVMALAGYSPRQIVLWAAAFGLGGGWLTAAAAVEQTYLRNWAMNTLQWLCGMAAVGMLVTVTGMGAGWFATSLSESLWDRLTGGFGIVAAAGLLLCSLWALARLDHIHRGRLVSGGSLIASLQGAAYALNFALLWDILTERSAKNIGHVMPRTGRGRGAWAVVWRDVQRLTRYPRRWGLFSASVGVPYAVNALGFQAFAPTVSAVVLLVALVPFLGSLRAMARTASLPRLFPMSEIGVRLSTSAVAAGVGLLWALLATPSFLCFDDSKLGWAEGFAWSVVTAAAGLLAAIRWVSAPPIDYGQPLLQVGFGAVPPTLTGDVFRGFDFIAFITIPLVLGWPVGLSLGGAISCGCSVSGAPELLRRKRLERRRAKKERREAQLIKATLT
ncbi:MAG: DUF6297 family protein [Propionibacteriaceae bacterium]|nr:DUF6297 family protein [Propionibacteriaceae bacterium]